MFQHAASDLRLSVLHQWNWLIPFARADSHCCVPSSDALSNTQTRVTPGMQSDRDGPRMTELIVRAVRCLLLHATMPIAIGASR